jgi:adenosine deaminase
MGEPDSVDSVRSYPQPGGAARTARPLHGLPKAHLHLHLTGAMRHATLIDLAREHGIGLPEALTTNRPPQLRGTDDRGWFRFQRLYDIARSVLRRPADVHRLLHETAQDERAEGSGWLEIQIDPLGYANRFGGLTPAVELVLDAAARASAATGVGIGVIIAANRTKHPLEARTLARLAARYAGRGVVGFGLSNDERRGAPAEFAPAFRIAARAGLLAVPHGGELVGPHSVQACLEQLNADRIGHGVRAADDPALTRLLAARGTVLEVCPTSNVALGVAARAEDVPLRILRGAGVNVALGADDPLLFGARLAAQYEVARHTHQCTDPELAELARVSVNGSAAPGHIRASLLAGIGSWLETPAGPPHVPATAAAAPDVPGVPGVPSIPGAPEFLVPRRRDGQAGAG